jgi:DNA-binding MarR family transcriptional regulator
MVPVDDRAGGVTASVLVASTQAGREAGGAISEALHRVAHASARQRAIVAMTVGVMGGDLSALEHIVRRTDITPGELAEVLALSSGGTTALIRRLRDAGLVTRSAGPSRHRRALVRASAAAQPLIAGPHAPLVQDIADVTADFTADEHATVERYLARLADRAQRRAGTMFDEFRAATAAHWQSPPLWS